MEELQLREARMNNESESEEEEDSESEEDTESNTKDEGGSEDKMAAMRARLEQIRLDRAANTAGNGAGRGGGAQPALKAAPPKPDKEKPKPKPKPAEVTSVFTSVNQASESSNPDENQLDGLTRKQKYVGAWKSNVVIVLNVQYSNAKSQILTWMVYVGKRLKPSVRKKNISEDIMLVKQLKLRSNWLD